MSFLSFNTAFCSDASKQREKVLEIETLDPTFQILQKEFFGKEDTTLC
jgi:hypothetical protein